MAGEMVQRIDRGEYIVIVLGVALGLFNWACLNLRDRLALQMLSARNLGLGISGSGDGFGLKAFRIGILILPHKLLLKLGSLLHGHTLLLYLYSNTESACCISVPSLVARSCGQKQSWCLKLQDEIFKVLTWRSQKILTTSRQV